MSSRRESRWRRAGWAAFSFLVAWLVSGLAWVLFARPWIVTPGIGTAWGDAAALLIFVAGFAAIGWVLVVLPLARYGDHDGWFFATRSAPLIGALCGIAILVLECAVFFQLPPWEMFGGSSGESTVVLVALAAVFGAVLWWTYTRAMRPR